MTAHNLPMCFENDRQSNNSEHQQAIIFPVSAIHKNLKMTFDSCVNVTIFKPIKCTINAETHLLDIVSVCTLLSLLMPLRSI